MWLWVGRGVVRQGAGQRWALSSEAGEAAGCCWVGGWEGLKDLWGGAGLAACKALSTHRWVRQPGSNTKRGERGRQPGECSVLPPACCAPYLAVCLELEPATLLPPDCPAPPARHPRFAPPAGLSFRNLVYRISSIQRHPDFRLADLLHIDFIHPVDKGWVGRHDGRRGLVQPAVHGIVTRTVGTACPLVLRSRR